MTQTRTGPTDGVVSGFEAALGWWQVADFGLSKQKQQTYVSGVSSSRGTLPWIAPEIIKSPEAVTEKARSYYILLPLP